MNDILSWLGWAAGGLLGLAVLVAGWEHLVREARQQGLGGSQTPPRRSPVVVDVPLDTASAPLLPEPAPPPQPPAPLTEAATRLAAMTQALSRAAHPGRSSHDNGRWMDTTPRIVGLAEPALAPREPRPRSTQAEHSSLRHEAAAEGPPPQEPAPPQRLG